MFRSLLTAAAFFAVGIGLAGCAGATEATGSAREEGRWEAEGPAFLILENGDLRGSDGCNGILGSYTVTDGRVEVTRGASTLRACPDVDTWLRGLSSAIIDGDTMTVLDGDGATIGTLTRKA